MDKAFSVIPEVFFDLIARYIPGAVFLLAITSALPPDLQKDILDMISGDYPKPLFILFVIILPWVTGLLLHGASHAIDCVYSEGIDPTTYALVGNKTVGSRFIAMVEVIIGGPEMWFGSKRYLKYEFPEEIRGKIIQQLNSILSISDTEPDASKYKGRFWEYLDYVRENAPDKGSTVVKTLATATCTQSLTLAFLIALFTAAYSAFHAPEASRYVHLPVLFFVLASVSSGRFSYYRAQTRQRLLLSLLRYSESLLKKGGESSQKKQSERPRPVDPD